MNVLVTGAAGFTATYLMERLVKEEALKIFRTDVADCDLTQLSDVEKLIASVRPKQIYHLAGSFSNSYEKDYQNNVLTTKTILDALVSLKAPCRVLVVGSAAEYGVPATNPVPEEAPLKPISIYGLTKVFQTHLMAHYVSVHGLDLVMARTFNIRGKGSSKHLFMGQLYHQIEEYKQGKISKLTFGDLSAERDYIEVREAVEHYRTIMNHGATGAIYNVGSGRPIKMAELLSQILAEHGLTPDVVEQKGAKKSQVGQIYADIQKLRHLALLVRD